LHLSVAAGIRSDDIARWLKTERVVRAMPNTPALIGKGISALFARSGVQAAEQRWISQVLAGTGELLWCAQETALDAVTALSGSGPAYVFYFLEAMCEAGVGMGLSAAQAHQLAVNTFIGAGELARTSDLSPATLRQQVTSQGGTTHAALTALENDGVKNKFIHAIQCARVRAQELGDEFGRA
jgi:pyrroline-5-carboxylate reductase